MPADFPMPRLKLGPDPEQKQERNKVQHSPIFVPTSRDCSWMWEYIIEHEDELLKLGYKELTIGPHNFD